MTAKTSGPKIWYIHPYAGGPGVGSHYRAFEICRFWNEMLGCQSSILMPSFHKSLSVEGNLPESFSVASVPFHAIPVPRYEGNGLGRVLQMLLFSARLVTVGRRLIKAAPSTTPDFIIASSPHPFAASAAARLARSCAARFVFEIRDIWPLSLTELGLAPRWHPFVLWARTAEQRALREAHLVSSVLPRANLYLAERGFGQKPFVWVPNGARVAPRSLSAERCQVTAEVVSTLVSWKKQGRTCMVYVGSMGPPNGITRLLDALTNDALLPLRDKLCVMLVGPGVESGSKPRKKTRAVVPVRWSRGGVAPENVSSILEAADFAYAGVCHHPNLYRFGVSLNKVPEYMAARLPVILPCAPCGDPVSEASAGLNVSGPSDGHLAAAIMQMASLSRGAREVMGHRGREYVAGHCRYEAIAAKYLSALESLYP